MMFLSGVLVGSSVSLLTCFIVFIFTTKEKTKTEGPPKKKTYDVEISSGKGWQKGRLTLKEIVTKQ